MARPKGLPLFSAVTQARGSGILDDRGASNHADQVYPVNSRADYCPAVRFRPQPSKQEPELRSLQREQSGEGRCGDLRRRGHPKCGRERGDAVVIWPQTQVPHRVECRRECDGAWSQPLAIEPERRDGSRRAHPSIEAPHRQPFIAPKIWWRRFLTPSRALRRSRGNQTFEVTAQTCSANRARSRLCIRAEIERGVRSRR